MLTAGGIIYDEGQSNLYNQCSFEYLDFIRANDAPYLIEVPNLTYKEIRYLDSKFLLKVLIKLILEPSP